VVFESAGHLAHSQTFWPFIPIDAFARFERGSLTVLDYVHSELFQKIRNICPVTLVAKPICPGSVEWTFDRSGFATLDHPINLFERGS
jgi:hypothetical protein